MGEGLLLFLALFVFLRFVLRLALKVVVATVLVAGFLYTLLATGALSKLMS